MVNNSKITRALAKPDSNMKAFDKLMKKNAELEAEDPYPVPKKVQNMTVAGKPRGFEVFWDKAKEEWIEGYQIRYSPTKDKADSLKINVEGRKHTSKKITQLKANKKYYVQMRAYKKVFGVKVFGPWTSPKTVKTKK